MFRLMILLCAGLYGAMLTLGQDHGQLRFGLMQAKGEKAAQMAEASVPVVEPKVEAPVVAAAFVPEEPLMQAEPEAVLGGKLRYVAAASVNVREGPGKDHAVVERLPQGEAVLVLEEGSGPEGWSLIRIEGDGVEGYVAARLLTK